MDKQVSLLKRGMTYIVDLYLGSLLGTLPISLATYIQLGYMTQNAYLLGKSTACLAMGLSMILMIFYYIIIPTKLLKGQTSGKRLMNIHITYEKTSTLVKRQVLFMIFMTSFGTMIGQFLSVVFNVNIMEIMNDITMSISLVCIAMIFFMKDHMGLYDKLAKTHIQELEVVKKNLGRKNYGFIYG